MRRPELRMILTLLPILLLAMTSRASIPNSVEPFKGHRFALGDWIAQWDPEYETWFYYNSRTGVSSWAKPRALSHVAFKDPLEKKIEVKKQTKATSRRSKQTTLERILKRRQRKRQQLRAQKKPDIASDRLLVSDDETYEFFGFNTTYLDKGSRGVLGGLADLFTGLYDNYVADYVTNQYRDFVEGYTDATLKLFAWFSFSSFLVIHGVLLNELDDSTTTTLPRSLKGVRLTEMFGMSRGGGNYTLPFTEDLLGLKLSFPVDNSLQGCYRDRPSCLQGDLPAEVSHLLDSVGEVGQFLTKWLAMSSRIGDMVVEPDFEMWN